MATNNTDFLYFSGELQQITVMLVNPYSSKSYYVDDEFNVNDGSYDGLGGTDYLIMTNAGDWLTLTNSLGMQIIHNLENIQAGEGGDVINLADATLTYGDVNIYGGAGDDILWANIGNDKIYGADGNDIIDGGPGNDYLSGDNGNDQIFGGAGNDTLVGGAGDDILYGGTDLGLRDLDKNFQDNISFPMLQEGTNIVDLMPPGTSSLGIDSDNLHVEFGATATLTFRDGFAGYNNSLGIFAIGEDGTIYNADILWANVKTAGIDTGHQIDLPVGADGGQFGFFIIANGDNVNNHYNGLDITGDGNLRIVYDFGLATERAATVHDDGTHVSVVYDDGTSVVELSGYNYFTTPRGESADINWDHQAHAVSGLADDASPDVLRIGFEDLPNLGDADFEDVLFDLDINRVRVDASEPGNDVLIGGAGNDILYGEAGDDQLFIGQDYDQAYGGSGSDKFIVNYFDSTVDKIYDFTAGDGGDVLNLHSILSGYDPATSDLDNFVQLATNVDGDTVVSVNQDGDIGGVFTAIVMFDGGLDATLTDLVDHGNLVL